MKGEPELLTDEEFDKTRWQMMKRLLKADQQHE